MEVDIVEAQQLPEAAAAAARSHEVRLNIGDPPPADDRPQEDRYRLRRVPQWVRDANEHAYAPKFMCIGPYHACDAGNSLRREGLKQRYADELLRDAAGRDYEASRHQLAGRCDQSLRGMISHIREFYDGDKDVAETDDDELVKMMYLDGCFIIKHLYNYALGMDERELFQSTWAPAQLRSDLTLLENQVPFAVLAALFEHLAPRALKLDGADEKKKRSRLLDMALWYMLKGSFPKGKKPTDMLQIGPEAPIDHLLHLLHAAHCAQLRLARQAAGHGRRRRPLLWSWASGCPIRSMKVLRCLCLCNCREASAGPGEEVSDAADSSKQENIPSAAELRNALGIRITMAEAPAGGGPPSLLDVRFREDRLTLEIPQLYVEQTTAPLLQNLIAYEQQQQVITADGEKWKYPDDYFTTYAFLMYNLVGTRADINLLEEHRILNNNFGSDAQIIKYFKNLCVWNRRSGSTPLDDVLQDLRRCKRQKVYRDWAEVKNYVNSPVKMFLLIISAMVSLSTVLQALVAVKPIGH